MSQWQTAGKVRMTPRGIWSASTAYVVLDCVSNTDKTAYYVAKQNVPAGTLLTNTEYWEVVNDISSIANNMNTKIDTLDEIVGLGYPTKEVAGGIATLENTIEAGLNSFTLYGKSVQNGTPSPSSPVSIATAGSSESIGMVSVDINTDIHIPITDTTKFIDENGNITDNADYLLTDYIPLSGNYLYVQWNNVVGSACYLRRAYYDSNKVFMRRDIHLLTQGQSGTFGTPLVTARYVRICVENNSTNRIYGLKVHDGYGVAIPTPNGLPGVPVTSGGNYIDTDGQMWICDTIDLDAGTWTKRVGVVTLDGSDDEGWTLSANLNYIYGFSGAYGASIGLVVDQSNAFPHMTSWSIGREIDTYVGNNVQVGESYISGGAKLWIRTNYSTIETFKAALADHPMTFVFPLVTPVTNQLTEAQLTAIRSLHSRRGTTYIYSSDPVSPGFDAEVFINMQSSTVDTLTKMNSPSVSDTGKIVTIDGTVDAPLGELFIYGKSAQDSTTPTPSAPVSIVTAGESGTLPMVSVGKNLAYMTKGSVSYSTGAEETSSQATRTGFIPIMGPRLYCTKSIAFASGSSYSLNARCYAADFSYIGTVRLMDGEVLESYVTLQYNTTLNQAAYIRFVQFYPDSATTPEDINLMIAFGDTSSVSYPEYVKASGISSAIPTPSGLQGVPVTSGGNYTDTNGQQWICDTIDLETGIWTKRCGTVILDNSRTDYILGSSGAFYTEVDDLIRVNDYRTAMICDSLTIAEYHMAAASATNAISGYRNVPSEYPGKNWMYFTIENVSTLSDLNTWLATHPIKVVYVLATPRVTKLTNTQLVALNSLRSRKEQTNLYSTDPAVPELTAKLYIDIATYINSLVN